MGDRPPIQFDDDIDLMLKAREGDRHAYARLYERYAPAVRKYIVAHHQRAESREDLVQEVFTRVWEHRDRYGPGMKVCPYLLGFARNMCREYKARAQLERTSDPRQLERLAHDPSSDPAPLPSELESAEQIQAIKVLLDRLPPRQRQAMELVYLAQMPIGEAAKLMKCSVTSLRMNVCRGRRRIERLIPK